VQPTTVMQNHDEGSRQNGKGTLSVNECGQNLLTDRDMKATRSPSPGRVAEKKRRSPNAESPGDNKIPKSCVLQPLLLPKGWSSLSSGSSS
jgi:hypothetical protein